MSIPNSHIWPFFLGGLFFSSCASDPELRITCEPLYPVDCEIDRVEYDTSKTNRNVLIIGIDGFRADAMTKSISPFLHQLSATPGVYFTDQNVVEDLTFSGPNWSSLVTGVHWCKHGVTDNDYTFHDLDRTPHFFRWVEEANAEIITNSIVNWTPINEHSAAAYADHKPDNGPNDFEVFELATEVLADSSGPMVVFLQFDELDGAGHSHGFSKDAPEYATTLTTIDSYIAQLHVQIEARRSEGEEWLVFVVSDHGGDGKSHGGGQDNEHIAKTVFFAECVEVTFTTRISEQVDLVPTVLDYLGVYSSKFECYKDGETLIE